MDRIEEPNRDVCMTPLAQLNDFEFRQVQKIVYETSGIAVAGKGRTLLSSRLRKRLSSLGLDTFSEYLGELAQGGRELTALMDAISTKETSFFRTKSHFDWFANEFLAEQLPIAKAESRELQIWSAACSTGEEAYSLAIILHQNGLRIGDSAIQLFASDLSTEALAQAQEAVYSTSSVSKLNGTAQRHFEQHHSASRLKTTVRERVAFAQHNLMQPSPYCDVDCLFLRNVLIYFDDVSRKTALDHAVKSIRPGGYLVVGPSEGVVTAPEGLERVQSFLFRRVA